MGGTLISFIENDLEKSSILRKAETFITNENNQRHLFSVVKSKDILIIQHPYEGLKQSTSLLKKCHSREIRTILFIHDLAFLRGNIETSESKTMNYINQRAKLEYGVDSVIVRPGLIYTPTATSEYNHVSSAWVYAAARWKDLFMKSRRLPNPQLLLLS